MPPMFYSIRHVTRFRYAKAVSESVMEVRVQPRSEGPQRLLTFDLAIAPKARIMAYRDFAGNVVHHFNIAGNHHELAITSSAVVEIEPVDTPAAPLDPAAWEELDGLIEAGDHWGMLLPSQFCEPTARLRD